MHISIKKNISHVWLSILQIISIFLSFSQYQILRENASVRFWVWIQPCSSSSCTSSSSSPGIVVVVPLGVLTVTIGSRLVVVDLVLHVLVVQYI